MRYIGLAGALVWAAGCSAASGGEGGLGGTSAASGSGGAVSAGGAGASIGLGGEGAGGAGGETCSGVSQEANNAVLPADVIWAIDTSCSMVEETNAVRENMNKFSAGITQQGVDIRIILIAEQYQPSPFPPIPDEGICIAAPLGSGNCPNDTNLPDFAHIFQTVGSTNALQLMLQTYSNWKDLLRPNSVKIFTVVTDDNSSLSAADFTTQVNALDPQKIGPNQWKVYAIYSYTKCPSAAQVGSVYAQLVGQTQGVSGDLCLQNFLPVFSELANGVIGSSKLDCGWTIPPPPDGQVFQKGKVNVVFTGDGKQPQTVGKVGSKSDCGPQGGWYYDNDANPSTVHVCDSTCQTIQADPKGKIDVEFGCATVEVPK
ncbi:MAG: hypothetical protein KF718_28430 [Polyangiaceae bacterium]|nr:hypothetical protein [Polyangiaceae bacterium]